MCFCWFDHFQCTECAGERFEICQICKDFRKFVFRAPDHDSEPFLSKDGKSAKPKPAKPSESKRASHLDHT